MVLIVVGILVLADFIAVSDWNDLSARSYTAFGTISSKQTIGEGASPRYMVNCTDNSIYEIIDTTNLPNCTQLYADLSKDSTYKFTLYFDANRNVWCIIEAVKIG
jgi:hypothetical protein